MIFLIIRWEGAPILLAFASRSELDRWLNDQDTLTGKLTFLATSKDIQYYFTRGIEEWPPNTALVIEGTALRVVSQTVKVEYKSIG